MALKREGQMNNRWKGELDAKSPEMCFFLKRTPEVPEPEVIAIAPGPEDKRKLPMELAIRFDKLKADADIFAAK